MSPSESPSNTYMSAFSRQSENWIKLARDHQKRHYDILIKKF